MKKLVLILALCSIATGCASYYGAAQIVSEPPGAEIVNSSDGTILGISPTTVWWKEGNSQRQRIALRFKHNGYYEKVTSFWLSMRHKSQKAALASPQLVEVKLMKKGAE